MRSYICVDKNVEKNETFPFLKLLDLFFGKVGFSDSGYWRVFCSLFLTFIFFINFYIFLVFLFLL